MPSPEPSHEPWDEPLHESSREPSREPWLRGTEQDVPTVARAVLHALQLPDEDLQKWCGNLSDREVNARPAGAAPVAFHIRHVARSLDRLLTYAEAGNLSDEQMSLLRTELDPDATRDELFAELRAAHAGWCSPCKSACERKSGRAAHRGKKTIAHNRRRIAGPHSRSHAAACRPSDHNGQDSVVIVSSSFHPTFKPNRL
jgi:hypothetical protein